MTKEQLEFLRKYVRSDGDLQAHHPWILWRAGEPSVSLDGSFTSDELEAIVWAMRTPPDKVEYALRLAAPVPAVERSRPVPVPHPMEHHDLFAALPPRTRTALWEARIYTIEHLRSLYLIDKDTLRRPINFVPGIGARGIKIIHDWLKRQGVSL